MPNQPQDRIRFHGLVGKNLMNRPARSFATIFTFAVIAATIFSSQYLMGGARQSLDAGISRMGADILVVPEGYTAEGGNILLTGQPTSFFFPASNLVKISRISGVVKASPQIYIATLFASCCAAPVQMIAIDPSQDFTISTWLKQSNGEPLGKDEIIIGSASIQNVGNDLMFYGHNFHVPGILERTGMGIDNSVFTRFEDAYVMADESGQKAVKKLTIPAGMISAVLVRIDPSESPETVAAAIQEEVPGTKTILPQQGLLHTVSSQLGAVTRLLHGSTIAVTVVSIPLLAAVSAMVAHERRREVSILRALGAPRSFIVRLMLAESFSLAIIGGLSGIAISSGILFLFQDLIAFNLKIPFLVPSPLSLLVEGTGALLLAVGIGGISSLYPVLLITRSEPYETIRSGKS